MEPWAVAKGRVNKNGHVKKNSAEASAASAANRHHILEVLPETQNDLFAPVELGASRPTA